MMMREEAKFDFPASLDHVSDVRSEAERIAGRMGFSIEEVHMIGTSAWEAVLNAVTHGSPLSEEQRVQAEISAKDGAIRISITSQNSNFCLPEFLPTLTPVPSRGRGLIIIRAFMDDVRLIKNGGCTLVMTKRLPGTNQ